MYMYLIDLPYTPRKLIWHLQNIPSHPCFRVAS